MWLSQITIEELHLSIVKMEIKAWLEIAFFTDGVSNEILFFHGSISTIDAVFEVKWEFFWSQQGQGSSRWEFLLDQQGQDSLRLKIH